MAQLESKFQTKVSNLLKTLGDECFFTVMQAGSIRGLPDIIGCYQGKFFGWELKRSEAEARKTTGRIALQKHRIKKIKKAGGIGEVVYPENLLLCFEQLTEQIKY